jgi:hypothetical protein
MLMQVTRRDFLKDIAFAAAASLSLPAIVWVYRGSASFIGTVVDYHDVHDHLARYFQRRAR